MTLPRRPRQARRPAFGWCPWPLLVAMILAACGKAPPRQPAAAAAAAPSPAAAASVDAVVAQVDLSEITVADVRARLTGNGVDAVLAAIGAAVLDALALRELAVLGLVPEQGETRTAAVDRLLAAAFAGVDCARVDADVVRLRYLSQVGRFRHPRSFTVWELALRCCAGARCDVGARTRCLQAHHDEATQLAAALRAAVAAVSAPTAVTAGDDVGLERSPCRGAAIPAFEAVVANAGIASAGDAAPPEGRFVLRRYTAFARGDARFPEAAFRRADDALEAALLRQPTLCDVVGPVERDSGLSIAMLCAVEAARDDRLEVPSVAATLRQEACRDLVASERDAFLTRLGASARVTWRTATIAAAFGADVAAALRPWGSALERGRPTVSE